MTRTRPLQFNVEMKPSIRRVLHRIQARRTIRFYVSRYPTMQIFSGATGRLAIRPAEKVDKTMWGKVTCRKIPGLAQELRCLDA
ncbi:MAG: hypothetical protein ABI955_12825, partial [Nitrospirota bacterium]